MKPRQWKQTHITLQHTTYTHTDTITGEFYSAAERMLLAIVLFALPMSLVHTLVARERERESGCMCVGGRECFWVWPPCFFIETDRYVAVEVLKKLWGKC